MESIQHTVQYSFHIEMVLENTMIYLKITIMLIGFNQSTCQLLNLREIKKDDFSIFHVDRDNTAGSQAKDAQAPKTLKWKFKRRVQCILPLR